MPDIKSTNPGTKGLALVSTTHDYPPIPIGGVDWSAVVSEYFDPERGDPIGRGATEEEAVLDLLRLTMENIEFDGAFLNALEGWLTLVCEGLPKEHRYGYDRCIRDIMGVLE